VNIQQAGRHLQSVTISLRVGPKGGVPSLLPTIMRVWPNDQQTWATGPIQTVSHGRELSGKLDIGINTYGVISGGGRSRKEYDRTSRSTLSTSGVSTNEMRIVLESNEGVWR